MTPKGLSLMVSEGGGGTKLTWNNHTWKNSFDQLNVSTKIIYKSYTKKVFQNTGLSILNSSL